MIYIGSVLGGPELEGSAIQHALKRIARLVKQGEEGDIGSLDIVFHVPGSLLKPDYTGVRTGRFSRKERMLMIQVSVPVEVVTAGAEPAEAFIIGSLREAIAMARVVFKKAGIPYSDREYLDLVEAAAKAPFSERPGDELMSLLRTELTTIPIDHWGFCFPAQVAVWRFIERMRPGLLDPLKASFKEQPEFEGKGSKWFVEELGSIGDYLDLVEAVMYPITRDAPPEVREAVRRRGFFRDDEIPPIAQPTVHQLADVILASVDRAVVEGRLKG